MINFSNTNLDKIIVHKVGNKSKDEGLRLSKTQINPPGEMLNELLMSFFTKPFKGEQFYHLFHESDLALNEVYSFVGKIFENTETFQEQSENLARHLYSVSEHPNIKSGEFYVVHFDNCLIDDEACTAVGLFKTEHKENYLNISENREEQFDIEHNTGININKIDKACLILNTEKDKGFIVSIADNTNKNEALYWGDEFLKIKERDDNYHNTKNYLEVCKKFADEVLSEVNKEEQIALKTNAIKYFAQQDTFNKDEFTERVLRDPETAQVFDDFKNQYARDYDMTIADEFDISDNAVKKEKSGFKSVVKLDKNYTVYIHGGVNNFTKGFDPARGLNFYQFFYENES
jgi:hypothetical protein